MRLVLVAAAAATVLAGCGSGSSVCSSPSAETVSRALAGAPPQLKALHAQANQLVGGSKSDFEAAMANLRGRPVVVNKWAAWCGPCRGEFPVFQKASLQLGKQVAFLGLDGQDNDGDARKFLACFRVSYPSYRDPDLKISNSIQAGIAFPTTIFFNRDGKLVYAHPGPYRTAGDLITDIRRYAG
jgi:cytochrome c biogenesis protein CcmG/thiol:disulfide interchange protein DsbE